MRTLSVITLVLMSFSALAQSSGDVKDIDGQKFTYSQGIWVHDGLGDNYSLTEDYTAVYKDGKWNKWYSEADSTLKKILDLGPNVVFKYKGNDGAFHSFGTFKSRKLVKKAVTGGSAAIAAGLGGAAAAGGAAAGGAAAAGGGTILGMSTTTAAIVGGAVVAGGVIIANNDDDDDGSPSKR